jgi:ubiquinone/menaquinone biosynthesis C-methylase UbiE
MDAMNCTASGMAIRPRTQFLRVLRSEIEACHIPLDQRVLIVGGSVGDEQLLRQAGFKDIVNSNLPTDMDRLTKAGESSSGAQHVALDAEDLDLPDDSYDIVFASEVLHHCISPHQALCEMIRVARRYVLFMEPNDSTIMNALVKMNFSFPYELPAVIDNDYKSGGLRDSQIPNFIYRWNGHEVFKTVSACIPERIFSVRPHPYWDFSVTKEDLELRKATRIGTVTSMIGTGNFIAMLRLAQLVLNLTPPTRSQGNKFFCAIEKSPNLKPWMAREGTEIVFNRDFGK